jgi:sugar phosphate isomerase/epimerase
MNYTRRQFGKNMLLHLPVASAVGVKLISPMMLHAFQGASGMRIGTISFSFKELKRTAGEAQWQEVLQDCHDAGLSYLEIEIAKTEPIVTLATGPRSAAAAAAEVPAPATNTPYGTACVAPARAPAAPVATSTTPADQVALVETMRKAREQMRQFRENPPKDYYTNIRKQAAELGITINAYTCGWGADYTDREIDAVFAAAKDLGATTINSSTTLEMAKRLAPFADKHQFPVAFHEHLFGLFSNSDDYASTLALSPYFRINFDIGHFTSSCGNPVALIDHFYDKISSVHIKDYKSSNGGSQVWGEGNSPIKPVVQLLKQRHFPGVITIELDYPIPAGSDSIAEVKKCAEYLKNSLA